MTMLVVSLTLLAGLLLALSLGGPPVQGPGSATEPPPSPGGPEPAAPAKAAPSAPAEPAASANRAEPSPASPRAVTSWVYQLQRYKKGRLDEIAAAPHDLAVIDLARDAKSDWFRAEEISALKESGKVVLAYFEIGSIEDFRPEVKAVAAAPEGLVLNRWEDWPEEHFVRYWEESWWELAIRPRLDQALAAGFDGVYLDTPLAYEEIDTSLVEGVSRKELARRMVALIRRMSAYAKGVNPAFWIVPQNSPELRSFDGYVDAIDGIGMEELFFLATDKACTKSWCAENLDHTRALRQAGKIVLAVDYANKPKNVAEACRRYAEEGFVGYVAPLELNGVRPPPCA